MNNNNDLPPPECNILTHSRALFATIAIASLLCSGCSTYSPDYKTVRSAWSKGDTAMAAQTIQQRAGEPETVENCSEGLRWMLNAGAISGVNGDFKKSAYCLAEAQAKIDAGTRLEDDDKSLADKAKNFVLGKYQPSMQEALMVPVLQIWNELGSGTSFDSVAARARALVDESQKMMAHKEKTETALIADASKPSEFGVANEKTADALGKLGIKTTSLTPKQCIEESMRENGYTDAELNAGFQRAVYVNPYARWLSAICLAHSAETPDSFNAAVGQLRIAREIDPENQFLAETQKAYEEAAKCGNITEAHVEAFGKDASAGGQTNLTYVIYEGGQAPKIGAKKVKMKVPGAVNAVIGGLIVAASNLAAKHPAAHVIATEYGAGAAALMTREANGYIPEMQTCGNAPKITVNGQIPYLLTDFDVLMKRRLEAEARNYFSSAYYEIIAQAAVRGVAIGGSLVALVASLENGNALTANIAVRAFMGAAAYSRKPYELSKPDSRTWDFLPRTVSVAQFATPKNGVIDISGKSVSVPAEGVNLVRVYKANNNWPAVVQVFNIGDNGKISAAPVARISTPKNPKVTAPSGNDVIIEDDDLALITPPVVE